MVKRRVGGGQPKPYPTHFVCVPLVTPKSRPQLEASLKEFREKVSPGSPVANKDADSNDGDAGLPFVHPKAIRPVGTLHCTLGVMSVDKDQLSDAILLLQGIDIKALLEEAAPASGTGEATSTENEDAYKASNTTEEAAGPITVDLKGLESMHAPTKTSILYTAPADSTGRLLPFCTALQKVFKDAGFITEDRPLKLHATIVNTIYAKGRKSQGHGSNSKAPLRIDATGLLERWKEFVWAEEVVLEKVAICEMGAKKILGEGGEVEDERYTEVASIELPI